MRDEPVRFIEVLCSLFKLGIGLDADKQNVLLDTGIYLAKFYSLWQGKAWPAPPIANQPPLPPQ